MSYYSPRVLLVGAGPTGLLLSLSLLKNGIPVRIIEKEPAYQTGIFRGAGIQPRTQEVEHFLGVLEDVKKLATGPPTLHVYDQKEPRRLVKTVDFVQDFEPTPSFPITRLAVLGQSRHQAIIKKHVEALGGQVEFGTEFSSLVQDDNAVSVTLTKTTGDTIVEETAKFDYVIGTDGGKSAVRKSVGIEFLGETKDITMFLADVEIEGFEGTGIHKWGETKPNVVQLNSHGESRMFQLLCGGPWFDRQAVMADDSIERLQQEFDKCVRRPEIKITKIFSKGEWRPNIRLANRFRSGRVFIAGDAAHTNPPTGGQGLNSSIMDSFNLGWKFALVLKGFSTPALLDSYDSERMPVIAEMLKVSTSLMNVAFQQNKVNQEESFKKAQDEGIIAKDANADEYWKRVWKLTQLDLNYRHSPIILDERFEGDKIANADVHGAEGHDLRAGDRAPEAPGLRVSARLDTQTQTTKLFDIFTPNAHTVLIFPTANEKETQSFVDSVVQKLKGLPNGLVRVVLILPKSHPNTSGSIFGIDIVVRDDEGHAYTNYGLNTDAATVVLVRPDAYIGGIVNGPNGVEKYFSMVFNNTK